MGVTDEDLLLRIEAADRTAAALLFDRYADLVFGIGLRILRDGAEAEDLVQEVFLGLVERVRGFNPSKGSGRTWIVQIAYRRAFDRRAYLRKRNFCNGTEVERVKNTLTEGAGFQRRLVDIVTGDQLHAAFEELNEKQRATLEMHFFRGLDLREISVRLGETIENTRHFYYRGLERLRKSVGSVSRRHGK